MSELLWTEAEEDEAWDEGGLIGVTRLAIERQQAEIERLTGLLKKVRGRLAMADVPFQPGMVIMQVLYTIDRALGEYDDDDDRRSDE